MYHAPFFLSLSLLSSFYWVNTVFLYSLNLKKTKVNKEPQIFCLRSPSFSIYCLSYTFLSSILVPFLHLLFLISCCFYSVSGMGNVYLDVLVFLPLQSKCFLQTTSSLWVQFPSFFSSSFIEPQSQSEKEFISPSGFSNFLAKN